MAISLWASVVVSQLWGLRGASSLFVSPAAPRGDPSCRTGIQVVGSECCCAKSCGVCGGKENRSCATTTPPCMLRPAPVPPPPPPARRTNPKRGFVADGGDCSDPVLLNTSSWFYDYNIDMAYRDKGATGDCAAASRSADLNARFVPMSWCTSSLHAEIPGYVNRTFFMGFNEPNNLHNCNKDAATIAEAWGTVMQRWPDSALVSPATAGDGIAWYDHFFGNCTRLYGDTGCNITYIATHDYSCDPQSTLGYLKRIHDRYGKKLWLTEFSCGDGAQARPTTDHLRFMRAVLPLLDAADFVYRYSWMSARDKSGRRGLMETAEDGSARLTELGELWNS